MHATHHALAFALRACKCGSKSSAAALCEAARSPAYASLLTGATVCHPRTARLRIPIKLQPAQATGPHSHTAELLRNILAEARSPACYRRRCTSLGAQHPFCRCTGTTSGPPVPPHIVQRRPRGCRAMDRAKPRAAALCLATAGLRRRRSVRSAVARCSYATFVANGSISRMCGMARLRVEAMPCCLLHVVRCMWHNRTLSSGAADAAVAATSNRSAPCSSTLFRRCWTEPTRCAGPSHATVHGCSAGGLTGLGTPLPHLHRDWARP